jgi:hypothetical protein
MAYVHRRRNSKVWTVYYYDRKRQKVRVLPRDETPTEIYAMTKKAANEWLNKNWAVRRGLVVHRAMRYHLREKDELATLWNGFQAGACSSVRATTLTAFSGSTSRRSSRRPDTTCGGRARYTLDGRSICRLNFFSATCGTHSSRRPSCTSASRPESKKL